MRALRYPGRRRPSHRYSRQPWIRVASRIHKSARHRDARRPEVRCLHPAQSKKSPQRPRCSAGQLHKGCRCWCVAPRWIMVVLCLCSELQWAGGLGLDLVDVFFASLPNGRGKLFVRVCSRGLAPAEHGSCLRGLATQWEGAGTKLSSFQGRAV